MTPGAFALEHEIALPFPLISWMWSPMPPAVFEIIAVSVSVHNPLYTNVLRSNQETARKLRNDSAGVKHGGGGVGKHVPGHEIISL